jgi:phosphate-selective porin OprO/OprP
VERLLAPRVCLVFAICLALAPLRLSAQAEGSVYDDIWGLADLVSDESNTVVQSLRFVGRFQYEYAYVEDEPLTHEEWNIRRMRLGLRSELFGRLTLHVETEVNPQERDPFYIRLTDAYVAWAVSPEVGLTVGKQGVPFTMDGATSSRSLITIDRSNLTNNIWFPQEYMPGASVEGESSGWTYQVGVYSSGEANKEFGELNAGYFIHSLLERDVGEALGATRALVRGTYVYQDPDPGNTFTRQLQHVGSLNLDLLEGRWGLRADLSGAVGYLGQSDLWGLMLMPFFDATPKLQFVGRYTHVASSDANGVRLARYESEITSDRGDRFDEGYLGVNYYFYGHQLKLQGGVQIAEMRDEPADGGAYSGAAATVGLRVSW